MTLQGNFESGRKGEGMQGETYMFLFKEKQKLNRNTLNGKKFSKEKEVSGESFFYISNYLLYKYLTCIELIKSIIMHTRNTNIPIHCSTPFTDAPHSLTV